MIRPVFLEEVFDYNVFAQKRRERREGRMGKGLGKERKRKEGQGRGREGRGGEGKGKERGRERYGRDGMGRDGKGWEGKRKGDKSFLLAPSPGSLCCCLPSNRSYAALFEGLISFFQNEKRKDKLPKQKAFFFQGLR